MDGLAGVTNCTAAGQVAEFRGPAADANDAVSRRPWRPIRIPSALQTFRPSAICAPPAGAHAATFKAPSAVTAEAEANADRRSGARPIINGWRTVNDHDLVVIGVGQTRRRLRAGALWRIRLATSCEGYDETSQIPPFRLTDRSDPLTREVQPSDNGPRYFVFFAGSAGRATPQGSYFSLGSGILSSAAL